MQPLTRMYRLHLLRNPGDERAEVALKSIARAATALVMGASYQVTQRKERHRAAQEGWRKYLRWLLRLFGIPL